MSIINSAPFFVARNSRSAAYEIEQSLRFDSSAYLYRSPSSAGNQNVWTISLWAKRGELGSQQDMYSAGTGGTDILYWTSSDQIAVDAPALSVLVSNDRFRDPSAWYHIVMAVDATNGTNSNRTRIYVNNREITSWATDARGSLTSNKYLTNSTQRHTLGIRSSNLSSTPYKGYESEFYLIDGQQLTPSDFGEYDNSGVWRPKAYEGTYGTNGVYLTFDSAGIGNDSGTNGHNWSHTGFTTSGTGTDVLSDTPTNNFCTINPLAFFFVYYGPNAPQNGNLDFVPRQTYSGNHTHGVGTFPMESGKWYFEVENDGGHSQASCGIFRVSNNLSYPWNANSSTYHYVYSASNGNKVNTSSSSYGASWSSAGDIVGVAYDGDNGTLTFYKNGTSQGTAFTGLSGTFVPRLQMEDNSGAKLICNFGQRDFEYTPPTGYKALSTSNIPAPTIKDGSKYFNTVLYTGNATSQSITGFGFQPDFAWVKKRNGSQDHELQDAVRGATKSISSSLASAETTDSQSITAFTSDGFNIGSSNSVNESRLYVAWAWKANGSGSSNTDGSITSTVSANPTAGFSIVSYTGTGSAATVGHGLGVAPSVVIVKNRDDGTKNWNVQFTALGNNYLELNTTGSTFTGSGYFNNTAPTSTVFSVGTLGSTNASGDALIAYCFAEVEGYSKFGSYEGNGNTDGVFIYLGFRPAWFVLKAYSDTGEWLIIDSTRDTYNNTEAVLEAHDATSETNAEDADMDFLSNGIKFRNTGYFNTDGRRFIFMAFAENPFGGSGTTPVTAR